MTNGVKRILGWSLVVGIALAQGSQAANRYWLGVSGDYLNAANWNGGAVPATNDTAYFTSNADYTVTFSGNVTNSTAYFQAQSGKVTLDIGSGQFYRNTGIFDLPGVANANASVDLVSGMLTFARIYVGSSATYNGSQVAVRNAGTVLALNSGSTEDIRIGNSGSYNQLLITNGATVISGRAIYAGQGYGGPGGSNNVIRISGAGSQLVSLSGNSGDGIVIGGATGTWNQLIMENSGVVLCTNTGCGFFVGRSPAGDFNSVSVGSGSVVSNNGNNTWVGYYGANNSATLSNASWLAGNTTVGQYASSNRLSIVAGGQFNGGAHVALGGAASSTGNTLVVSDSGSRLWSSMYDISVGRVGFNNTLLATNGATVTAYRTFYVGGNNDSATDAGCGNTLVANGSNTLLQGLGYGATASLMVGKVGTNNTLRLENGAVFLGISNSVPFALGYSAGSLSNAAYIGAGCVVTNLGNIFAGRQGDANRLMVSNATFSGGSLYVGESGSRNLMVVQAGATYRDTYLYYVGANAGANSNTLVVTDPGTLFYSTSDDGRIGGAGHYNTLMVSNGATATCYRDLYAGQAAGSWNQIIVSGTNSLLRCDGVSAAYGLAIGMSGTNNTLYLENGAVLSISNSKSLNIGYNAGSLGNSAFIGAGCVVTNTGLAYVGRSGDANTMTVSNATVYSGFLNVGYTGTRNTLTIRNGGVYQAGGGGDTWIGSSVGANSNTLLVTGSGSQFYNTAYDVRVGESASCNSLIVSNGGLVTVARDLFVGHNAGAATNTVLVVTGGCLSVVRYWTVGADPGNVITNRGGTYRFVTAYPAIALNGANHMYITDGTIEFKNVNGFDVKGNWSGTGLTNLTWAGNNTLRLDGSTNNTTGQSYTFAPNVSPTNYARLELVNGSTYRGGSVTIGAGGSALFSNGTLRVSGSLTNLGTLTVADGTLAVSGTCVFGTNATINMVSNSVAPSISVSGAVSLPATATFTYTGGLARDAERPLISAPAGITGSAADWTVNPPTHRLKVVDGTTLLMVPRATGFVIAVE